MRIHSQMYLGIEPPFVFAISWLPPRENRKVQREYDAELYKLRHWVENAFLTLKRWRGIATRYAKNTASFLAAVQIRCIVAWM